MSRVSSWHGVSRVSNFGVEVTESVSRFRGVEEVVEVSCVEARFQASGYFCRCMCGCFVAPEKLTLSPTRERGERES